MTKKAERSGSSFEIIMNFGEMFRKVAFDTLQRCDDNDNTRYTIGVQNEAQYALMEQYLFSESYRFQLDRAEEIRKVWMVDYLESLEKKHKGKKAAKKWIKDFEWSINKLEYIEKYMDEDTKEYLKEEVLRIKSYWDLIETRRIRIDINESYEPGLVLTSVSSL